MAAASGAAGGGLHDGGQRRRSYRLTVDPQLKEGLQKAYTFFDSKDQSQAGPDPRSDPVDTPRAMLHVPQYAKDKELRPLRCHKVVVERLQLSVDVDEFTALCSKSGSLEELQFHGPVGTRRRWALVIFQHEASAVRFCRLHSGDSGLEDTCKARLDPGGKYAEWKVMTADSSDPKPTVLSNLLALGTTFGTASTVAAAAATLSASTAVTGGEAVAASAPVTGGSERFDVDDMSDDDMAPEQLVARTMDANLDEEDMDIEEVQTKPLQPPPAVLAHARPLNLAAVPMPPRPPPPTTGLPPPPPPPLHMVPPYAPPGMAARLPCPPFPLRPIPPQPLHLGLRQVAADPHLRAHAPPPPPPSWLPNGPRQPPAVAGGPAVVPHFGAHQEMRHGGGGDAKHPTRKLQSRSGRFAQNEPSSVLFVGKLHPACNDGMLVDIFREFGCESAHVKQAGRANAYAFVHFRSQQDTIRAFHEMNSKVIRGASEVGGFVVDFRNQGREPPQQHRADPAGPSPRSSGGWQPYQGGAPSNGMHRPPPPPGQPSHGEDVRGVYPPPIPTSGNERRPAHDGAPYRERSPHSPPLPPRSPRYEPHSPPLPPRSLSPRSPPLPPRSPHSPPPAGMALEPSHRGPSLLPTPNGAGPKMTGSSSDNGGRAKSPALQPSSTRAPSTENRSDKPKRFDTIDKPPQQDSRFIPGLRIVSRLPTRVRDTHIRAAVVDPAPTRVYRDRDGNWCLLFDTAAGRDRVFHSSNTVLRISSIPVVFEQFEKEREDLVDARQRWARGLKRAAIVDLKRELRENVTAYVRRHVVNAMTIKVVHEHEKHQKEVAGSAQAENTDRRPATKAAPDLRLMSTIKITKVATPRMPQREKVAADPACKARTPLPKRKRSTDDSSRARAPEPATAMATEATAEVHATGNIVASISRPAKRRKSVEEIPDDTNGAAGAETAEAIVAMEVARKEEVRAKRRVIDTVLAVNSTEFPVILDTADQLVDILDDEDAELLCEAWEQRHAELGKPANLKWIRNALRALRPEAVASTRAENPTGCARTEGYDALSRQGNGARGASVAEFNTNLATLGVSRPAAGPAHSRKRALAKQASRSNRAEQRRYTRQLAPELQQVDVLQFNKLQMRSKVLRFSRSAIHGWGLYALEPIQKGDMVIEYVGEVIRQFIADYREEQYEKLGMGSSYLFRLDENLVVDATRCGCFARFINHSCEPNCYAQIITVEGRKKIVFYSKTDIARGEEVTYDYKFPIEDAKLPCSCGAKTCRGFLN